MGHFSEHLTAVHYSKSQWRTARFMAGKALIILKSDYKICE